MLFAACLANAVESGSVAFKNITVENGLSDKSVMSIYQDRNGYVWIGTRDGLHRYDGANLLTYKSTPFSQQTLTASYISSITESSEGHLWIGTDGGGVNIFDPVEESFSRSDLQSSTSAKRSTRAWRVLRTSKNQLLVATLGGGVTLFSDELKELQHFEFSPSNRNTVSSDYIEAIAETPFGDYMFGTDGQGMDLYMPGTAQFKHFTHDSANPHSLPNNDVTEILVSSNGNVWVGTDGGGLARFDLESEKFYPIELIDQLGNPVVSVMALAESKGNILWAGTWNQGLFKIELDTDRITQFTHDSSRNNSLVDNRIWDLFVDRNENLLIGTHFGLSILPVKEKSFNSYSLGVKNKPRVLSIASRKNGEIYVGTDGLGLLSASAADLSKLNKVREIEVDSISALMFDDKDRLWLGSYNQGLFRMDLEKHILTRQDLDSELAVERINSIFQDSSGRVWVATSGDGLYRYPNGDDLTVSPRSYNKSSGITNLNVSVIYEDSQRRIWIGSYGGGLYLYNELDDSFSNLGHDRQNEQSLSHIGVTSILEVLNGELWVATYGGGITRLSNFESLKDIKFNHFFEGNGLLSNVVYGLIMDQFGDVWMSTALGLNRFDSKAQKFVSYGYEDGISSNYFNAGAYHKTVDNKIYFGSNQLVELTEFHRHSDGAQNAPILNSISFLSTGKKVNIHGNELKSIEVNHRDNGFFLSFANLDFISSKNTEYSYLIDGFSDKWISLGDKNEILISGLAPGRYSISVRSRTFGSNWVTSNDVLAIVIHPPFWKSTWFSLILLSVVASFLYAVYQLRFVAVRKHNKELQNEIDSRQKLEKSLVLNKLAVDSASNGVSIIEYKDGEFIVLECNLAFAKIFQLKKDRVLSRSLEEITLSTFNKRISTDDIQRTINQNQYEFERNLRYADGSNIILKFSISRIQNGEKDKQYMLVMDDVTKIRKKTREKFIVAKRRVMEQEAIIRLATSIALEEFTFEQAAKYVTKIVTQILDVERVSIWLYSTNKKSIECVCMYLRKDKKYQSNMVLNQSDFPNYFEALKSERVIEASDIEKHPATSEFTELYARPHNIKSLLDAPINVVNGVLGVVCIEQTKRIKNWKEDEINFAKELADQMAKIWLKQESKSLSEQLLQSQKMKTIGTMASGVAHDFNNILTPILGSIELIDKDPSSSKTGKRLERIRKAANRAKNIVQQMLDLSRTSRHLEKERIDISKIILESTDFVKVSAPKRIQFLIENQEDLFVYGNSTKFNQLLVNILINAVHAVEERGRIKVVSRKFVEAQQSYVSITIEDDGHGMSSDFLKTIFEPFVSTKVKGLGTGLGLSVALSIVSEMDGTIDVTSRPNVGTKFTIILPEYK